MWKISNSIKTDLKKIAKCHIACFPSSLNVKLGTAYVEKSFEWFVIKKSRFLFHIEDNNNVVGFCGGFVPQSFGDGSSSGMLQLAFKEAIIGILKKPWLLLSPELKNYYPFIFRNIKKKLGLVSTTSPIKKPANYELEHYCGLVVIGVHPKYRGKKIFELLMLEFEKKASELNVKNLSLSVRVDNHRAIGAYKKMGWVVKSQSDSTYLMTRVLN